MEARVSVHGDVTVVHLSGQIDYDSHETFRQACLKGIADQKLIFDLSALDFVGSNAITPFVNTLAELGVRTKGLRMYGVGPEFKKIFGASPISELQIYDSQFSALGSFLATFDAPSS